MSEGSTGSSGSPPPVAPDELANNRRQGLKILLTMVIFFVGLVLLACWGAAHG
ncbi:MAG TPA: hypothetical protein VGJ14_05035 [Sporichthyaceae bacterium]|jgi:hypothetical protein